MIIVTCLHVISVNAHVEYVQQQVVAELASSEIASPLTPFVIGDFKAYGGKLSDKYVNLNLFIVAYYSFYSAKRPCSGNEKC